jgi:phosphopantothenate---cysteine ligase (CTP)
MRCVVTAGPTIEPLDEVRRLTNSSTGRLGTELACHLAARGHKVTLLRGEMAVWPPSAAVEAGVQVAPFRSAADLRTLLLREAGGEVGAVFHAAAVSDFAFGRVWRRGAGDRLVAVQAGKLSTRDGALLAELLPTTKIILELRGWFPRAWLVGWKYEVDGGRDAAIERGRSQLRECRTDVCVVNGPAYGPGYGVLPADGSCTHVEDRVRLLTALTQGVGQ